MTHNPDTWQPVGELSDWQQCQDTKCWKCNSTNIEGRIWESSCGGYEDYNYHCQDCNYFWWVDGIDS